MSYLGVPVIYLLSGLLVCLGILLTWRLKRQSPRKGEECIEGEQACAFPLFWPEAVLSCQSR